MSEIGMREMVFPREEHTCFPFSGSPENIYKYNYMNSEVYFYEYICTKYTYTCNNNE